jgi:fructose-bisphosphate aldolase class II
MRSLLDCIRTAQDKKIAIGHFNISNMEMLHGIFHAAQKLQVPGTVAGSSEAKMPVIIGISEGERDFVGVRQAVALIKSLREEFDYPIFLNADHSYSFERVKEAVDAGFDSAIIDGAKLSFEENIAVTKKCVDYARQAFEGSSLPGRKKTLIEAELGYIGQSSKVLDEIPAGIKLDPASLTSPEQAKEFVARTGIDLFAPAVGNIHGMLRVGHDPRLDIKRVAEISAALTSVSQSFDVGQMSSSGSQQSSSSAFPLVLHGGSGTVDEDFTAAIHAGIAIVHISTELRVAYQKALKLTLQDNPEEVAPYKYLKPAVQAVEDVVFARLKLFNGI